MNIDFSDVLSASVPAFICFLITMIGLSLARLRTRNPIGDTPTHCFQGAWKFAVSTGALLGAALMPLLVMIIFYAFVLHIRLGLGRWPHFGESLEDAALKIHLEIGEYCVIGLFFSLYAAGVTTLFSFAFKRIRWLSFSCLLYMAFAGLSLGSLFLAPHKFLNWLFD